MTLLCKVQSDLALLDYSMKEEKFSPNHSMEMDHSMEMEGEKQACGICLENYKEKEKVVTLSCKHIFHKECIETWLSQKQTCPIDRINPIKEVIVLKQNFIPFLSSFGNRGEVEGYDVLRHLNNQEILKKLESLFKSPEKQQVLFEGLSALINLNKFIENSLFLEQDDIDTFFQENHLRLKSMLELCGAIEKEIYNSLSPGEKNKWVSLNSSIRDFLQNKGEFEKNLLQELSAVFSPFSRSEEPLHQRIHLFTTQIFNALEKVSQLQDDIFYEEQVRIISTMPEGNEKAFYLKRMPINDKKRFISLLKQRNDQPSILERMEALQREERRSDFTLAVFMTVSVSTLIYCTIISRFDFFG